MDFIDAPALPQSMIERSAHASFNYAWVSTLLEHTVARVRAECMEQGMKTHWALFHARVVQPTPSGEEPPSLAHLCELHDIADPQDAEYSTNQAGQ